MTYLWLFFCTVRCIWLGLQTMELICFPAQMTKLFVCGMRQRSLSCNVSLIIRCWCCAHWWMIVYCISTTRAQCRFPSVACTLLVYRNGWMYCWISLSTRLIHHFGCGSSVREDIQGGQKVSRTLLSISLPNIGRFSNFFTGRFCGKFIIKWLLNKPPHLNCVDALQLQQKIDCTYRRLICL